MINSYAVDEKYLGKITGKFNYTSNPNELTIFVTDPFKGEILIKCDSVIGYTYSQTISLIEPKSEHIMEENKCYYHTKEENFYLSEYQEGGIIPKKINSKFIIQHTKDCQRLQSHFQSLHKLHKGQYCSLWGYAIDRNDRPMHPSTVESSFYKHKWFYNPFTFEVALLDENTIDDFVEEIPISKEMTNQMVLYHQKQDKNKQQKEKDDKKKNKKEKWETRFSKINDHFGKYEKIYRYGIGGGFVALLISIIQLFLKIF